MLVSPPPSDNRPSTPDPGMPRSGNAQNVPCGGAEAGQRFGTHIGALVKLLFEPTPAEVRVQRPAWTAGDVPGAAVPEVTVEDNHGAGLAEHLDLGRVRAERVGHDLTWQPGAAVAAGYHPGRPVDLREVIDQPDRVAHPVVAG